MGYKKTQRELKRPDEFQKIGEQAVPWMERHGKTVVGAVLGLAGLGLVFAIYDTLSNRNEQQAQHELGNALRILERPVKAEGDAAPGEPAPFKTETEKDEALVAGLTEFRSKHAGRVAATNAALSLGQALLRLGRPAEALPLIDEYLQKSPPEDLLRPAAWEAKGYALEAEKKYDEAMVAFDALSKENKTDFMKGMGQYHSARILILKGDKAGAAKQLSELETQAPGTAAARLAKERVALLASEGVAVPQTAAATAESGS